MTCIASARPDELEGLLELDWDVERVSKHSNFRRRRKQASRKKNKKVTLFGFDLFGKRRQGVPVKLSGEDYALHRVGQEEEQQRSAIPGEFADGDGGDGEGRAGEEGDSTTATTTPRKKRRESRTPRPPSNTNSLFPGSENTAPLAALGPVLSASASTSSGSGSGSRSQSGTVNRGGSGSRARGSSLSDPEVGLGGGVRRLR